jgi:hypothetical protein
MATRDDDNVENLRWGSWILVAVALGFGILVTMGVKQTRVAKSEK